MKTTGVENQKSAIVKLQEEMGLENALSDEVNNISETLANEDGNGKIESNSQKLFEDDQIKQVRVFIASEKQPKNLNIGQQNKHVKGTNEYKQKVV